MTMDCEPASLLVLVAHPPDAELWAAGTLLIHERSARIDVAVELAEPAELAEAQAAAGILGAQLHLTSASSRDACADLLRRLRPQVVVTHDPEDPDDAHRRTASALLSALRDVAPSQLPRRLYRCGALAGLGAAGGSGTTIVDVTATYERKLHALDAYGSLTGSGLVTLADQQSRSWGNRIGVERAEGFLPLPILGRLPIATHL